MAHSSESAGSEPKVRVYCVELDNDKWKWGAFLDKPPHLFAPGDDDARTVPAYAIAASDWIPLEVSFFAEGRNARKQKIADFTRVLTGIYAVSARARRVLEGVCGDCVDWLPLKSALGDYYWMRVNRVLDALDKNASICDFYDEARVLARRIDHHVFRLSAIGDAPVFFLKEKPESIVYCTAKFAEAYRDAGLTGLRFELVFPLPRPSADPAPAPSLAPPESLLGTSEHSIQIEPLSPDLQSACGRAAERYLRKSGDELAAGMSAELDARRALAGANNETLPGFAHELGIRFGYLLARELHWLIQWGKYGNIEGIAVVSPDSKFAIFPAHLIYAKATNKDETNTILLLYNMLKSGQRPPSPASGTKLIW